MPLARVGRGMVLGLQVLLLVAGDEALLIVIVNHAHVMATLRRAKTRVPFFEVLDLQLWLRLLLLLKVYVIWV